jgi:HEAT repeat protein
VLESDFKRLLDDEESIYHHARDRLISMGRAGLSERLARHLDEDNPIMRERIADLLGPVGDIHHADFLCDRLIDPVHKVRIAIIRSLGDLAVERSALKLLPLLADSDTDIRMATVGSLKRFDQRALKLILPNLENLIGKDNDLTRLAAFDVLSKLRDTKVDELMHSALGDRFVEVRVLATITLGERSHEDSVARIASLLADSHARCPGTYWRR